MYGIYVTFLNYDILRTPFHLTKNRSTSIGIFILLAFLTGFVIMGLRFLLESWRRDRENRRNRKTLGREADVQNGLALIVWHLLNKSGRLPDHLFKAFADESHPVITYVKAEYSRQREPDEDILQPLRALVRAYPSYPALSVILAHELIAANLLSEAEDILSTLTATPRTEGLVLAARRNLASAKKEWSESISMQKKLISTGRVANGDRRLLVGLQYEQAKELFHAGQTKPALTILRSLQRDRPKFVPAWVLTGDLYIKEAEPEKALATWKEGFVKSNATILLHRLSQYYLDQVQAEKAIEVIAELVFASENDIIPRFFLGRLYYRLEMHEEALREFSLIKPRVFRSPTLNYLLGILEEKLENPEKAAAAFRRAALEGGTLKTEYFCMECQARFQDWNDRCPECASWNSIEIDYPEEKTQPKDLGLEPFPIRFPTT